MLFPFLKTRVGTIILILSERTHMLYTHSIEEVVKSQEGRTPITLPVHRTFTCHN